MKVAVVGAGISGLAVCHVLGRHAQVTLFEAADYFGGHTHTVDVTLPGPDGAPVTHGVDTGFLVLNERTYPRLIELFGHLGVPLAASDMSFSVQVPGAFASGALEWSGSSLATVFAQPANLARPAFLAMLRDLLRFNVHATRLAQAALGDETMVAGEDKSSLLEPLGEFLDRHRYGRAFRDWYLLPMLGCIWSCPVDQMLRFPLLTLVRFCHNHGLLQVTDRPQWFTVPGGARRYVDLIVSRLADARRSTPVRRIERDASGVQIATDAGIERFDQVVLATHSDQALALLAQPSASERELLGAIAYQPNTAVLHTDATMLPTRRRAWAAWNYERGAHADPQAPGVCLHYLINRLQPLPWTTPVIVSLNPVRPIAPERVLGRYAYAHPVFDAAAVAAQARLGELQGRQRTWFCGAWTGYGFHEDGLKSGEAVARRLLVEAHGAPLAELDARLTAHDPARATPALAE